MTQKHYIEIADMLNDQRMMTRNAERDRVSKITKELALIMKRDNRRFDAGKFFTAAGFPELTNSAQGLS
jgi:hypothetical protein